MNIAVIGSRTFNNFQLLEEKLHNIIYEQNEGSFKGVKIISGGAKGADSLAIVYAKNTVYLGKNISQIGKICLTQMQE